MDTTESIDQSILGHVASNSETGVPVTRCNQQGVTGVCREDRTSIDSDTPSRSNPYVLVTIG